MHPRKNSFEIKAGLTDIQYFGSHEKRTFGGLRGEGWSKIKRDGERVESLASYFNSLSGLASVQYDNDGKLKFIGQSRVRYSYDKITYIGNDQVLYDFKNTDRICQIGELPVIYDTNSNRILYVGGESLTYYFSNCIYDDQNRYQAASQENNEIVNAPKPIEHHEQRIERTQQNNKPANIFVRKSKTDEQVTRAKDDKSKDLTCIPSFLASLTVIVNNQTYWENKTRIGSMPQGVREIKNYLNTCLQNINVQKDDLSHPEKIETSIRANWSHSNLTTLLASLANIGDKYFSKDYEALHQFFRGRNPKVNHFYGVISGLTTYSFHGGSKYYIEKRRYAPLLALEYLKTEFDHILDAKHHEKNNINN